MIQNNKMYYKGFETILEKTIRPFGKYDLVVEGTSIETKFSYESDLKKLEAEMNKVDWSIETLLTELDYMRKKKEIT